MRGSASWVVAAAVVGLGACATTQTGAASTATQCMAVSAEAIPAVEKEKDWKPKPLPPGFLRIHYRSTGNGVFAIGVHYVDVKNVTVPFIVELPEVPESFRDDLSLSAPPPGIQSEWFDFFTKLRQIRFVKPGGAVCRANKDCAKTPDSPPPEFLGSGSSGGTGGIGMVPQDARQLYAELARARLEVSDATQGSGSVSSSPERVRIVNEFVVSTCRGIQVFLGRE